MYAVVKINGKQHVVRQNEVLKIDRVMFNAEDVFEIKEVLAVGEGENMKIGSPLVGGAVVKFKVLENKLDKKVIVFKKKRRKRYEVKKGHRQHLSVIRVESISV